MLHHTSTLSIFLNVVFVSNLMADAIEGTVRFPAGISSRESPAVVYLRTPDVTLANSRSIEIDQRGLKFLPRVHVVPAGGTIRFRNSDRESHNVNSLSDCCPFNLMVAPGREIEIRTERPGLIRLCCNLHPQMRGYVVVSPNELFAVTDPAGRFTVHNVPRGEHKVVVWQELSKPQVRSVVVAGTTQVTFELESWRQDFEAKEPAGVTWTEAAKRIADTLGSAIRAAQEPGGIAEADQIAQEAYFEHFEATGLENAVRVHTARAFDLECKFARIRNLLLTELAEGRIQPAEVREAVGELDVALQEAIVQLHARGVFGGTHPSDPMPNSSPRAKTGSSMHSNVALRGVIAGGAIVVGVVLLIFLWWRSKSHRRSVSG